MFEDDGLLTPCHSNMEGTEGVKTKKSRQTQRNKDIQCSPGAPKLHWKANCASCGELIYGLAQILWLNCYRVNVV